jgi:hypothetical protein
MSEQYPENNLRLNKLAKQALQLLKVAPDPTDLYLLQLVRWCLDYGKVHLEGPWQAQSVLKEFLDAFNSWSPRRVMEVFQNNDLGEPVDIYPPGPLDPAKLAGAALDQLHSRLAASLPTYPVASPLD